ncbi:MAG: DNA-binding response regulator, LuxR family [Acidobacteriales bacterium]|nr:DNA-binding response regulator, LuxR family [Terriglobales bacterium]
MSKQRGGQKITVLISDSSRMGCQLLSNVLKTSRYKFSIAASVTSSQELLASIGNFPTDVAVISASLQDGALSGLHAMREVHSKHPNVPLIVLLDSDEKDQVVNAFRSGASGIFCRAKSPDELCKCVYAVHQGQIWASANELRYLLEAFKSAVPLRPSDANGNRLLTRREEQVVTLVADGMSNREISAQLRLSEHTVKNYMFRIFNKLGISSRVELILYAINHNGAATPTPINSTELTPKTLSRFQVTA